MENSCANCFAFSIEREATAATSASLHCSIPGTARRRAMDAALNIPHFTFLVIGSPMMSKRKNLNQQSGQCAANQRAKYGYCRVVPSRRALSRDGQNRVSDPWPKVARGIDRVTCRAAQRKSNAPNQAAHKKRPKSRGGTRGRHILGKNREDHKHKRKCGYDFTQEIHRKAADRG